MASNERSTGPFERSSRLIPSSTSSSTYKNNKHLMEVPLTLQTPSNEISLRDDILYGGSVTGSSPELLSPRSPVRSVLSASKRRVELPLDAQQERIVEALGVTRNSRVLQFEESTNIQKSIVNAHQDTGRRRTSSGVGSDHKKDLSVHQKTGHKSSLDLAGPLLSTTSTQDIIVVLGLEPIQPMTSKHTSDIISLTACNILQAPGLRNDFYSNLVCWSRGSGKVAVGLGNKVYLWGIDNKVESINLDHFESVVTSVSNDAGSYLIVALADGSILLIDEGINRIVDMHANPHGCIYCFKWKPNSNIFFAGDEIGSIFVFEILHAKLCLRASYRCAKQQVCGISINEEFTEIAVGGNNNSCTIWKIEVKENGSFELHFKSSLPHDAAVKAMAFCPWCKSLLATGSGSRDRKIRFWHTGSATLLSSFDTKAQITSISWSKFNKQLVATFGFGVPSSPLLSVYSYPSMRAIKEVRGVPSLRILSSTMSPDNCSICVATNDSTIRIYKLWTRTSSLGSEGGNTGYRTSYGSSIIELHEGVSKSLDLR